MATDSGNDRVNGATLRLLRLVPRITQQRLAGAAERSTEWVRLVEQREFPTAHQVERYVSALDRIARGEA